MRLVLRRARGARSLLLAALVATLIAVSFVVGLLAYGQEVVADAARATIAAAPPDERSVLVRGSAGAGGTDIATKDAALRDALSDGIGGRPVDVSTAGYSSGRELVGPTGDAVGDDDGAVFANVAFLDDLAVRARLVQGAWARPGQPTTEATLPRSAAVVLQIEVGEVVPILDRRTDETTDVVVTGIWEPVEPTDGYWLLVPGLDAGVAPGSSSYGPITVHRTDFLDAWAANGSVAWAVRPDLAGAGLAELIRVDSGVAALSGLPERVGLGDSVRIASRVDRLVDRLERADLVGRSSLLTPVLLVVVLGGYALLLIAMLLTEHRRGETALMRARGASRPQLGGLAVREAALLVLPAIAAAPPLSNAVLRAVGLDPRPGPWLWVVAGATGLVCAVAMVGPSLRRSGTYIEELGARSRPSRFAFAQRMGVDAALVVLAAIAWLQLRQYASPLTGAGRALGIDPLLVSAPTIGVLAGAVVSLRLLPRVTGLAERLVDRGHWPATMFGMWQAGRRPHAGPVLLLALAAAVSTLAWSMLSTAQRSIVDQADFAVGTDLRLVEANGFAPDGRTEEVNRLPGIALAAPVSRTVLTLGPENTPTAVVGVDAARAADVMYYRDDLRHPGTFADVTAARPALPVLALPAGATRLTATAAATVEEALPDPDIIFVGPDGTVREPTVPLLDLTATVVLLADDGHLIRLPLGTIRSTDEPRRFEVALPPDPGLSVVRISVSVLGQAFTTIHWSLTAIETADAAGTWSALDLTVPGDWVLTDALGATMSTITARGTHAGLTAHRSTSAGRTGRSVDFAVMPAGDVAAIPVAATPDLMRALGVGVGERAQVSIGGARVGLLVVGQVAAVPGTARSPSALLADLPSLAVAVARQRPAGVRIAEHWVAVEPGGSSAAVQAATALSGVRVLDRVGQAEAAGRDPYGLGGRTALFGAGAGALLLALIGIAVDVRATARRRVGEFAVLQTMGAGSRLLSRAVLAEQGFLAGLGVLVGLGVGVGVAASLAPLVILTPSADRPEPPALLSVPWLPVLGTAAALFVAAIALSGAVAATLGRRLAVARLRIGDEG